MSAATIERLIAGTLPDPDSAGALAVRTRRVVIAEGLADRAGDLLVELGLPGPVALVADPATHGAMGARVATAVEQRLPVAEVVFAASPKPDEAAVAEVLERAAGAASLVAVGSGTINDVTKYAAARSGRRYAVFGTALSMNGYTSENAAITVDGHKKSLAAAPAEGVFLDLDVLAAAPVRLTRAGLGDSICRPTAQADWLLAHVLLGSPYRTAPFRLLEEDEGRLLAASGALGRGEPEALAVLARTLVLSGFGMALCGGSWPASQAEHLVSHWIDMLGDPGWPPSLHGEHIAVTTLAVARVQEAMLRGPAPRLSAEPLDESALIDRYGPSLGRSCWAELARKRLDVPRAVELTGRLARDWPEIVGRCRAVSRYPAELEAVLARAGAPTKPAEIGVPAPFFREAVLRAREIRDRFTFLDLAALSGRLEALAPPP
jgi:glycerol-1-phosphate dehydrogenase [NAD(P)+]